MSCWIFCCSSNNRKQEANCNFLFQRESVLSWTASLRPSLRQRVATHSSSTMQKNKKKTNKKTKQNFLPPVIDSEFAHTALFCRSPAPPGAPKYLSCSLDTLQEYIKIYESRVCKHKHEAFPFLLPRCSLPCSHTLSAHNPAAILQCWHLIKGLRSQETGRLPS